VSEEGLYEGRFRKLLEGLEIIRSVAQTDKDYAFDAQHDVLYVGNPARCSEYQIKRLEKLRFNVDEDGDCFYVFT
jgi:hypothetical protein